MTMTSSGEGAPAEPGRWRVIVWICPGCGARYSLRAEAGPTFGQVERDFQAACELHRGIHREGSGRGSG